MKSLKEILLRYQQSFATNSKKRKCWISSRQIGKSFTIAYLLCYKALSSKNGLSLCISVNARSASEIIMKCKQFAEAIKLMSKGRIDYDSSYDSIKFSTGSRVMSLPGSTDGSNLRGWTANCICIDEAAFVPHLDSIMQGIAPTLTRDPNSELILTTTPAGKNGYFYSMYSDALNSDEWYVQNTTIQDAIADGLKIDLDSLKSLCPDPDVFAQEYECKFLDEYGSMIDTNLIDWYDDMPKGNYSTIMGMDIGSRSDRSAIVQIKTNGRDSYVDNIVVLNKTSYEDQLRIVKELHNKEHFHSGYIDQNGIGSAISEFITKQVSSRLKGFTFTGTNKTPMYEALRGGIFDHSIKFNLKYKDMIVNDFNNVQRIVTEDGKVKYQAGHNENGHSDITSGLVLALQSLKDNPIGTNRLITYTRPTVF